MRDAALVGRRLDVLALGTWTLVDCERGGLLDQETALVDGTTLTLDNTGRANFEGFIESVDLETGTVMLMDSVRVRIGEATMIPEDAELGHLEAVVHALEEGDTLVAWGHGRLEGEEPRVVAADEITFRVPSDGTSGDAMAAGRLHDAGGPGAGPAIAATESRAGHA